MKIVQGFKEGAFVGMVITMVCTACLYKFFPEIIVRVWVSVAAIYLLCLVASTLIYHVEDLEDEFKRRKARFNIRLSCSDSTLSKLGENINPSTKSALNGNMSDTKRLLISNALEAIFSNKPVSAFAAPHNWKVNVKYLQERNVIKLHNPDRDKSVYLYLEIDEFVSSLIDDNILILKIEG